MNDSLLVCSSVFTLRDNVLSNNCDIVKWDDEAQSLAMPIVIPLIFQAEGRGRGATGLSMCRMEIYILCAQRKMCM